MTDCETEPTPKPLTELNNKPEQNKRMNTNEYQKYKKIQKMFTTVENNIFKKK